jgi:hypothetical protein
MSVKVSSWVWHEAEIQDIKGNDLVLLLALADVANDKGMCTYFDSPEDATYDGLATKARIHRSTIAEVIGRLERRGVLERKRRGPGLPNEYRILIDQESGIPTSKESAIPTLEVVSAGLHSSIPRIDVVNTSKRGSRISESWSPNESDLAFIHEEGPSLDVATEVASFRDYWLGVAGAKGVKLDWSATWRNHVRRQHKWNVERGWQPVAGTQNWAFL